MVLSDSWNQLIGLEEVAKYANLRVPIVVDVSESVLPTMKQNPNNTTLRSMCDYTHYPDFDPDDYDSDEEYPQPRTVTIDPTHFRNSVLSATHLFVVYDGPGPNLSGFALLNANTSELSILCSSEKGKRYGGLLMAKAQRVLREAGKTQIVLYAMNSAWNKLIKYYESLGFKVEGEIGKAKDETTKMTKSLVSPRTYKQALTGTSRLQKQTRRAKRHTRNHKGRQLRKLTTRRR